MRRTRERENNVLDAMCVDDISQIPTGAENGQRRAVLRTRRLKRILVQEPDRVQTHLGMLAEPLREEPADAASADDQGRCTGALASGGNERSDDSGSTRSEVDG